MLEELIVTNLGLIEEAHLEPGPGLVVVTGETGAGKTMLLGALRLLMGASARKDLVGPAGDEATVQARFDLDGEEVLVARRISRTGRSKAYLDGLMTPLRELEGKTAGAVELVAQHDHLRLTNAGHIKELLDAELDISGRLALAAYRDAWLELTSLRERQAAGGGDRRALERELETVRFQAGEIAAAGFAAGDEERLNLQAGRLRNAQGIVEALDQAATELGESGIETFMDRAVLALTRAGGLDPTLENLETQAADVASLVAELRAAVSGAAAEISVAPGELDEVEERLALLGELRRKYGASLAEVLTYQDAAERRAAELTALLDEADGLATQVAAAERRVAGAGVELTAARRRTADRIAEEARDHLVELGLARPSLAFTFRSAAAGPGGADRIDLMFASDEQLEAGPVGRIASGGELSRLVLALRLATGADDAAVVAFDEIDAGVGGSVALALGRKLARLAGRRQVLCVTHLPQVAAHAQTHYVVRRDGRQAVVEAVDGDARIEELTRMLAGMPHSERGRQHAAELLTTARQTAG